MYFRFYIFMWVRNIILHCVTIYKTLQSLLHFLLELVLNFHRTKPCKIHWLPTHLHAYGNERVNPHSTKPCKPHWRTTHLHAYGSERVNPYSTKPCKPQWLTTHLHVYGNKRVTPHSTKPCKPCWLTSHLHAYGNERLNTFNISLANPIDLLHIYMPMVMRGLTEFLNIQLTLAMWRWLGIKK